MSPSVDLPIQPPGTRVEGEPIVVSYRNAAFLTKLPTAIGAGCTCSIMETMQSSLVGKGSFDIALSVPLVLEYEEVLLRQVAAAMRRSSVALELVDYLCAVGKRQSIFFLWRPCLADPDDDAILELAVAAGCEAIVTHNRRDFAAAVEFGIRVVSPGEFLEEIGGIP